MARSVLASELLLRLRQTTDSENDTHVSDAELYRYLTSAVADTWDKIQAHGLGGEAVKSVTFDTVPDQIEYNITTTLAADFYKVKTLYVDDGTGLNRPITRTNPNEEYARKGPSGVVHMKLYYVPCAPKFTTGTESFDGINGWEEHTIQTAAVMVKAKKQDDGGQYKSRAREIEERMKTHANRNADDAPRVIRRRGSQMWANRIAPFTGAVMLWDIRGGNLELYGSAYGLGQ